MGRRRPLAREAAEFAAAILAEWIAQCATPAAAVAFGRRAGRLLFARKRYPARALEHLRLAFPEWSEARRARLARRAFANMGAVPVEALRILRGLMSPAVFDRLVEVRVDPEAAAALAAGRGAVFVTAHLGNWELLPLVGRRLGISIVSVGRAQDNRLLDRRIGAWRRRLGQTVVEKHGALRVLGRALRAGRSVALVVDQDARDEGVFVPFFGRLCSTYDSAAALALRFGVPLVPAFLIRRPGGRFLARVERPVSRDGLPADPGEARLSLTARMNERIESCVRRHPDQWIWHYRRWKTRPPEEKGAPPPDAADCRAAME